MMNCNVKDYEAAFNFLLEWLKGTRETARECIHDSDDEVQFAVAAGYLQCCKAAIVIAENLRRVLEKDGNDKND